MNKENSDPVNNREDFEIALKSTNNWQRVFCTDQAFDCLLFDMPEMKGRIKKYQAKCTAYNQNMLRRWDNAPDESGRREVVSEVVRVKED